MKIQNPILRWALATGSALAMTGLLAWAIGFSPVPPQRLAYAGFGVPPVVERSVLAARAPSRDRVAIVLSGSPDYLGTIDCTTTSKTNHEATAAFNNTGDALLRKAVLLVNEGTVAVFIHPVSTNTGTVTSNGTGNHGVKVGADERVIIYMEDDDTGSPNKWVACKTASSTADLRFFDLQ